jgi:hypothetical protein
MSISTLLNKFNPESNKTVKSILYAIGSWGVIHLSIMCGVAIYRADIRELNTLVAINMDKFIPSIKESYVLFVISWVGLIGTIVLINKRIANK